MSSPAAPGKTRPAPGRADGPKRAVHHPAHGVDGLQASVGNRAVTQLLGNGEPMPDGVRAEMEARFGTSFADVRIHTGQNARFAASAMRARAFTHGADVVFGREGFAPQSAGGKRLLAHELAHVVQQRRGGFPPSGGTDSLTEIGAERAASDVSAGTTVSVQGASSVGIAKSEEQEGTQDGSVIAPLINGFRQRLLAFMMGGLKLGGPGAVLLGKSIEGMSDQLYEELWVSGRGKTLLWNVLSLGPVEMAKALGTYQIGLIEGALTPATDLFGMAVFGENVRNTVFGLARSAYNNADQIGPELRALLAGVDQLEQTARDSLSEFVNDPEALGALLSLPQAAYALAQRNAYDLGKAGGLQVMAALESPWKQETEEAQAPELGLSTFFSWIGSKVDDVHDWGIASPGAKIGEALGYAVGMVAVQVVLLLASGGFSGALKGAGGAVATVGTAVARITPRGGSALARTGAVLTLLGEATNEISRAINALDDVAIAALKRFMGKLSDAMRSLLDRLEDVVDKLRSHEDLPTPRLSSEELSRRIRGGMSGPDEVPTEILGPGERSARSSGPDGEAARQQAIDEIQSGPMEDWPEADTQTGTGSTAQARSQNATAAADARRGTRGGAEGADTSAPSSTREAEGEVDETVPPGRQWKAFNPGDSQAPQGFTKYPDPSPDDVITEVPGARPAASREPAGAKQFRPAAQGDRAAAGGFQKNPDPDVTDAQFEGGEVIGVPEEPALAPPPPARQPGSLIESPIAGTDDVEMIGRDPFQTVYSTRAPAPDPVPEVIGNQGPVPLQRARTENPEMLETDPAAMDPAAAHHWKRFVDAPEGATQTPGFQKFAEEAPEIVAERAAQGPTLVPEADDLDLDETKAMREEAEAWAQGWGDPGLAAPALDPARPRRRRPRN